MDFKATPLNVVVLLLVALAVCVLRVLSKKRVDSNLPLLFYAALLAFTSFTDRHVNAYLFGGGLLLAFLLRFEFLNQMLVHLVLVLEMLVIVGIAAAFLVDVFGLTFYW